MISSMPENLLRVFLKKGQNRTLFRLINSHLRNLPTGIFRVSAGISGNEDFKDARFAAGYPQAFPQTVEKSGDKARFRSPLRSDFNIVQQVVYLDRERGIRFDFAVDYPNGRNYRRVVAPEYLSDGGQGKVCLFPKHIYGNMTRP